MFTGTKKLIKLAKSADTLPSAISGEIDWNAIYKLSIDFDAKKFNFNLFDTVDRKVNFCNFPLLYSGKKEFKISFLNSDSGISSEEFLNPQRQKKEKTPASLEIGLLFAECLNLRSLAGCSIILLGSTFEINGALHFPAMGSFMGDLHLTLDSLKSSELINFEHIMLIE